MSDRCRTIDRVGEATKRCPDCRADLPVTAFGRDRRRADGLCFYCKPCMNARQRASANRRRARDGKPPARQNNRSPAPEGMRWCAKCKQFKLVEEFGKNRASRSGLTTYCRPCHNATGKAFYTKKYGSTRTYHLKQRYGMTADDVDAMIEAQGGTCAACRIKEPRHVDHDHHTGAVRGILCFTCNVALGNAKDEVATLRGLVAYLRRHGAGGTPDPGAHIGRWLVAPGVWRVQLPAPQPTPVPT
jgi:hypothetical protein